MRKIREILRLKYEAKLTNCQIAQSCNRARSTIANYWSGPKKPACVGRCPMSWTRTSCTSCFLPIRCRLHRPAHCRIWPTSTRRCAAGT